MWRRADIWRDCCDQFLVKFAHIVVQISYGAFYTNSNLHPLFAIYTFCPKNLVACKSFDKYNFCCDVDLDAECKGENKTDSFREAVQPNISKHISGYILVFWSSVRILLVFLVQTLASLIHILFYLSYFFGMFFILS